MSDKPASRRVPRWGRIERHSDHRLWVGGPVPPGSAGITLGQTVIVRAGKSESKTLLAHELVHVRQYREHGVVRFWRKYLAAYFAGRAKGYPHWSAYRRIPFEVEAIWETTKGRTTRIEEIP